MNESAIYHCIVFGRPYVKKNNQRAFGAGRFKRIVYSKKYLAWESRTLTVVRAAAFEQQVRRIDFPVRATFRFFFENRQSEPDLSALYEGIQDVLEKAGVILNDKLILSHDGSGKFFGSEPRTEVELYRLEGGL